MISLTKHKNLLYLIINILVISLSVILVVMNTYAIINSSTSIPVLLISNILFPILFGLLAVKSLVSKDKYKYLYLALFLLMLMMSLISIFNINIE
jgi:hypothetical protein